MNTITKPALIAIVILLMVVGTVSAYTYSFVHISDTQNANDYFPAVFNLTFSTIEGLKSTDNITAIIFTGDIVNSNTVTEWNRYIQAKTLTSIPIYEVAGSHDINDIPDWTNWDNYVGTGKRNWSVTFDNFVFVGIAYGANQDTLNSGDLSLLQSAIILNSTKMPIIATHYYMPDDNVSYSNLAKQIQNNLIFRKTLILSGHVSGRDRYQLKMYNGSKVYEAILNQQDAGVPLGNNTEFKLYTVTVDDTSGIITKLTSETHNVYPISNITNSQTLFSSESAVQAASFTSNITSGPVRLGVQFIDSSSNTPTARNWSYSPYVPIQNGLVAEYRFNERTGQILNDYSGNGNIGTLGSAAGADTNDPTWVGDGASFTTNDYIITPTPATTGNFTLFAVFTPTNIAIRQNLFGDSDYGIEIGVPSGGGIGALGFNHNGDQGAANTADNVISNNTKYYFAFTKRGTGTTWRIYKDGLPLTLLINKNLNYTTSGTNYIGVRSTLGQPFEGTISYLSYYNLSLTDSEILNNYNYLANKTYFSSSANPIYTFNSAGNYSIIDTVTNIYGKGATTGWINATPPPPLTIHPMLFINDTQILPFDDTNLPLEGTNISINATPDQYEWSSFVLKAATDISGINITSTLLSDGVKTIPKSSIDIRLVKAWYQASTYDIINVQQPREELQPELLLKNNSLISVNYTTKLNTIYIDVNGTEESYTFGNSSRDTVFPAYGKIYDNATASGDPQLFSLLDSENKQVWITIHVPAGQAAGNYTGKIWINQSGITPIAMNLSVRVLPFTLQPATMEHAIYYRGLLPITDPVPFTLTSEYKTETQYAAELEDMYNHGIKYPVFYNPYYDASYIPKIEKALALRNASGLPKDHIYMYDAVIIHHDKSTSSTLADLASITADYGVLKNITNTYGYGELYAANHDEPLATDVPLMRNSSTTLKTAGGKLYGPTTDDRLLSLADMIDTEVIGLQSGNYFLPVNTTFLSIYKAANPSMKLFIYGYPQVGVEYPETYRRNYGLALWKSGYAGAMDYAYQAEYGQSIWNDYDEFTDGTVYRDHVFAYPKTDGVIDTIEWEGYREGVDDSRYADTLVKLEGNDTSARAIISDSLSKGENMATIREKIITKILIYSPTSNEKHNIGVVNSVWKIIQNHLLTQHWYSFKGIGSNNFFFFLLRLLQSLHYFLSITHSTHFNMI